jgi:hypothetical protein
MVGAVFPAVTGAAVPESFELEPMQPANEATQTESARRRVAQSSARVLFVLFM